MTTIEARWFWPLKEKRLQLPAEFKDVMHEARTDYYFPARVGNVGVKWRENNLEIKSRLKSGHGSKASRKFSHIGLWEKQILYENIDPATLGKNWLAVQKKRWRKSLRDAVKIEYAQVNIGNEQFVSLCIESENTNSKTVHLMEKFLKEFAKSDWDSKEYPITSKFAGDYPDLIVGLKA